ncbi:MAG TPA: putative zinc-binding metallopeptidase [Gemmataceae bacterium]|nr:putative zinc-binding metallopeptidase [Gemmataceae bacterium]
MSPRELPVHEANPWKTPLRDLGLTIHGTPLEKLLQGFLRELQQLGLTRVEPRFYLSTEWGVPFGTISIAIPFYLARSDLTKLHAERGGLVEGAGPADILRYLRHEMGHVFNYAYKLYEEAEWVRLFGDIDQDYIEEYRPRPFHPDFVRHLPGWYAQKHPDEDWAETFAVWMTPGLDWRRRYTRMPAALAKLEYCDRTMNLLRDREPLVREEELDEDVSAIGSSLDDFYQEHVPPGDAAPPEVDDALQTIFGELPAAVDPSAQERRSAAMLIRRLEHTLGTEVFRWTAYFPEHTRVLLRRLAERAESLGLAYPAEREADATVALTAFVTALALSHPSRAPSAAE